MKSSMKANYKIESYLIAVGINPNIRQYSRIYVCLIDDYN